MKVNATGRFAVHDLASTVNGKDKMPFCPMNSSVNGPLMFAFAHNEWALF